MAFEEPGKARYSSTDLGDEYVIRIPSRKHWFVIAFLGFWLVGWALGEFFALNSLRLGAFHSFGDSSAAGGWKIGSSGLFLIVWLGAWTVGGLAAIYAWLWQIAGAEEIKIRPDGISLGKQVLFLSRSKEYRRSDVQSLRISSEKITNRETENGMNGVTFSGGQLAFDYGIKTIYFGSGLDEAEARAIYQEMRERLESR